MMHNFWPSITIFNNDNFYTLFFLIIHRFRALHLFNLHFFFLLSSIYIRRKHYIRGNFPHPVFDGFTCFEMSEHDLTIFTFFYLHKKKVLDSRKFSTSGFRWICVLRCPVHDMTIFRKCLSLCMCVSKILWTLYLKN